jgi:galactokinase
MKYKEKDILSLLPALYATDQIVKQRRRYQTLVKKFESIYASEKYLLFCTPGRTELSGNHTDHNHGRVLAASVDLDIIAVAAASATDTISVYSEGYEKPFKVDLASFDSRKEERSTTNALIRGVAAGFRKHGFKTAGFNACLHSQVLPGSGLSSSAAVEVILATIFNTLFNGDQVSPETLAKIGQFAENEYFGKPCGLMDQMACAVGGIVGIDFKDPSKPQVKKIKVDFDKFGYALLVVNTGGSHVDLTADYAAVPTEMKEVARAFGKSVCRELNQRQLLSSMGKLRSSLSDRSILRAYHFLTENQRVNDQIRALEKQDFGQFLSLFNDSGASSFRWLQNIYSPNNVKEQGLTLALALTEHFFGQTEKGACRVHGGGFAGTILVLLRRNLVDRYKALIEPVFGKESVSALRIRNRGTTCLTQR